MSARCAAFVCARVVRTCTYESANGGRFFTELNRRHGLGRFTLDALRPARGLVSRGHAPAPRVEFKVDRHACASTSCRRRGAAAESPVAACARRASCAARRVTRDASARRGDRAAGVACTPLELRHCCDVIMANRERQIENMIRYVSLAASQAGRQARTPGAQRSRGLVRAASGALLHCLGWGVVRAGVAAALLRKRRTRRRTRSVRMPPSSASLSAQPSSTRRRRT